MMVHAFILIKSAPGKDIVVKEAISKIEGIKEVHPITGPWDLVVIAIVADLRTFGDIVMTKIRVNDGICETCTLVCVE